MNLTIEAGRRELTLYIRVLVYNLTCVVVVVVVAIVMMRIYGGLYYCNKILHKKKITQPTHIYIRMIRLEIFIVGVKYIVDNAKE